MKKTKHKKKTRRGDSWTLNCLTFICHFEILADVVKSLDVELVKIGRVLQNTTFLNCSNQSSVETTMAHSEYKRTVNGWK